MVNQIEIEYRSIRNGLRKEGCEMQLNLLAIGDVVAESGLDYLTRSLRTIRREEQIDFVVCNGENASGVGITPQQAQELLDCGVDVVTLGNHTWGKIRLTDLLICYQDLLTYRH